MTSVAAQAPSPETRERILDAAEGLFAAAGYDGTSMRQIAAAARVNGAAANYHFGSKEELYTQVFLRRIVPINAHRAALLDAAEAAGRAAGREPTLNEVFGSFARPVFATAERAPAFLRLLARNVGAPPPFLNAVLEAQFRPLIDRYGRVLRRLLPQVPPKTLFWRMHFIVGAMLHCASHLFTVEQLSAGLCRNEDAETMLRELIDFAVAGMTAPAVLPTPVDAPAGRKRRG
jgi:AcrR family transcriptional regulator